MTDILDYGAVFTQSGVPVEGAADYQRVYDSRWRFMEMEIERVIPITLPATPAFTSVDVPRTNLLRHSLGFVPYFEAEESAASAVLRCDQDYLYIEGELGGFDATPGGVVEILIRIYNIPILEEYAAPKTLPEGLSSPRSDFGIRFLDGHTPGASLVGKDSTGRSFDSSKKLLSIHKHGLAYINTVPNAPDPNAQVRVSAIDTSTDIFTVLPHPAFNLPIDWLFEVGATLSYEPQDFSTRPGGLPSGTYYSIPIDSTHVQLATSLDNARASIAVNITSAGPLPGTIYPTIGTGVDYITHDVGYPPSFLICPAFPDEDIPYVGPAINTTILYITADAHIVRFRGIQAVFMGVFGYIILKDPAEIAR